MSLPAFLFSHHPKSNANAAELQELFWQNNISAFSQICQLPGSDERMLTNGWARFFTGRQSWIFNSLFPLHKDAEISEKFVNELVADHRKKKVPFFIGIPSHFPGQFSEVIRRCGPQQETASTTVVYSCPEVPEKIPSDLTFKVVESAKQSNDWVEVFTDVFQGYGAIGEAFTDWAHHYKPSLAKPFLSVVGYMDDRPVTVGSISVKEGVVAVYNVGTRPAFQKQGNGALLMNCLIRWCGSQGYKYFGGEGSTEGMHLYRKLSIQEVGTSRRFIWD